ncbi:MAG: hypothetical protein EXX96DRAFT_548793 [Benjaminiella poitrasii]|nr:MAG: hypothetical protein EXX96DRAFT_548793 [Benjaminiella poitrasii]
MSNSVSKSPSQGSLNDTIFEVEHIIDHRQSQKKDDSVEYLIKWKGYDDRFNTWERESNVYAKGLIYHYWLNQPYTLAEFRKNIHIDGKNNGKNKNKVNIDRKQIIQEIKASQISSTPPAGYLWTDIYSVENVFYNEPNVYFAEVKWSKNEPKTTYIPTRILKKHNPLKLIHFYEKRLEFYLPSAEDLNDN